jgi:hypothetical protein
MAFLIGVYLWLLSELFGMCQNGRSASVRWRADLDFGCCFCGSAIACAGHEQDRFGPIFPDMGCFAHHQEIAYLSEQASFGAGASDVLGEIGAVHGATDPTLRDEPRAERRDVAKKGVVEVAEAGGQVFFGLRGQEKRQAAAGPQGGEGVAG